MSKTKKIAISFAVILSLLIIPAAQHSHASVMKKAVDAWYRDIKIVANGTQVQMPLEPFIMNDSTYVPIRAISEILGKNVGWDGATSTVTITDKPGSNVAVLNNTIIQQNSEITRLKAQIADLKEQLDEAESSSGDLRDLEDELNDDYSDFEDIEFDINLDGDEDDIQVEITFEGDEYLDAWYDLSDSDISDYLQDIVDDILDEFDDADIEGTIEDTDNNDVLVEFTIDSDGDVSADGADLSDLEDQLQDDYSDFEDIEFDISLDGDEDDILVNISFEGDKYLDAWEELTDSDINDYLQDIVDDILDEFDDADIEGTIEDTDNNDILVEFTIDSDGDVSID